MYRSILVPLDGSVFGESALPLAVTLARKTGATLHVVHVHVPLLQDVETFDSSIEERLLKAELKYLESMTSRFNAAVSARHALLNGGVEDTLHEHVVATGADLIVMTTHGRGPLARFWLGSVADELVRRMPVPILLVRPQDTAPSFEVEQPLRQILIPLDGSVLAEQMLEPALALGSVMQAGFTLLRIVRPQPTSLSTAVEMAMQGAEPAVWQELQAMHEEEETTAHAYLARLAERFVAQSLPVQTRIVRAERPAVAILDEARTHAIDLIAVATHGRGGLARLLLGSVADKIVRGATIPVLVYRPRAHEKKGTP